MAIRRTASRDQPRRRRGPDATFYAGGAIPSPESPRRRRAIHAAALFALSISAAYLLWRALATLGANLALSVPLLVLEASGVVGLAFLSFALWDVDRRPLAPRLTTRPKVAVLIPSLNEPREVLIPTIAAAVALQPAHETYLLDDGNRPWAADLASRLGALYVNRDDHAHGKAGNINNALRHVAADFVAVVDADHVVRPGFLTETLGYFSDPKVAIVQTPQDFYNVGSFEHARNRSWMWRAARKVSFNEQRLFHRALQPAKNRWDTALWSGSGAVLRVAALREVGGMAWESDSPEVHTTLRLHRRGWSTVYHNEVLSYGLAARTAAEYQAQRRRWAEGALQVLRLEHPLTRSGLTRPQKISYACTLLGWLRAWRTLAFLLAPLAILFSGRAPLHADALTFASIFAPVFLAQRLAAALLTRGYAPQGTVALFDIVRMPASLAASFRLLRPRRRAYHARDKGGAAERQRIRPPWLLTTLLLLTVAAGLWFLLTIAGHTPVHYALAWTAYAAAGWAALNAVFLLAARRRIHAERFATERRTAVRVRVGAPTKLDGHVGGLIDVSVGGALVWSDAVPNERALTHRLEIKFGEENFGLSVDIHSVQRIAHGAALVVLRFADDQDHEIARLGRLLFAGVAGNTGARVAPAA